MPGASAITEEAADAATAAPVSAPGRPVHAESLKHTVNAIIIAFVLAFIFRGFIVEPFIIPTGSMAPTLLGAHTAWRSPETGETWAVTPRDYEPTEKNPPLAVQGARDSADGPLVVVDPVSRLPITGADKPLRPGDRILVQKYIYVVSPPRRWDVVVFKSPESPDENFIKRLVGLPGEELRIVDGDVFTRPLEGADRTWRIQRKPERVQRGLWRPLFSGEYAPVGWMAQGHLWQGPWWGDGWRMVGLTYRSDRPDPGPLSWEVEGDDPTGPPHWPIDDWVYYNETPRYRVELSRFPVSDLRVRAGVEPQDPGASFTATIIARGHEFQGVVASDGAAAVRMRALETADAPAGAWRTLGVGRTRPLRAGRVTEVEFAHADQALALRVGGETIARGVYDWDAEERLRWAGGRSEAAGARFDTTSPANYLAPRVSVRVDGSRATLHRLGLDADLAYQPSRVRQSFRLEKDQFFVLGDNSAASRDARVWDAVDPWVAEEIDPTTGVVPRELLMGKAFLVYFPAPHRGLPRLPVPDFGRMRWIR